MANIAFFGLGTMGLPIATNLAKAGHTLYVMPRNGKMEAPKAIEKLGGVIVSSVEEMVKNAEFIISVVPNDQSVKDIYFNDTMKKGVQKGTIIIEMTSCSPDTVIELAEQYKPLGVSVIDAPITGALPKAISGTLFIIGAGDKADFDKAQPVFAPISEKVFQLGKVGNGKLIKAMTNLLGAINLAAVGEFYRFAKAQNLDMQQLIDVVAVSAGGSIQFTRNFEKIVAQNFTPTFTLDLLRKDMGIALDYAKQNADLCMPLAECAYDLYSQAHEFDKDDCCSIARVNKKREK